MSSAVMSWPSKKHGRGGNRDVRQARLRFHADLEMLALRKRRQHDLRRTFITLRRTDGTRNDLLDWISHGPSSDMLDTYTTFPWPALCAEIQKLTIERRMGTVIAPQIPAPMAAAANDRSGTCGDAYFPRTSPDRNVAKLQSKLAEVHGNRRFDARF